MHEESQYLSQINSSENQTKTLNNLNTVAQGSSHSSNLNLGLGLGLGGGLKVDLGDHEVFPPLDSAEHDFGNVLNNLPPDAFNDIFIGNYTLIIAIYIFISADIYLLLLDSISCLINSKGTPTLSTLATVQVE